MTLFSDADFNKELELAAKWAKEVLASEPHKGFVPALIAFALPAEGSGEREVIMAMMPDFDADQRHEQMERAGYHFGQQGKRIVAIYFVTEAWLSLQPNEHPRRYARPADDPQREEVVNVAGLTLDGHSAAAHVKTTRDRKDYLVPGAIVVHPYVAGNAAMNMQNNVCKPFFRGLALGLMENIVRAN